jgi:flagellin-like protein
MMGRRGISPLIATILLIAFAVALGSLVYSYIIVFQGGTGARGCSSIVSIDSAIKTPEGEAAYLLENGQIVIDIRNTGYTDISSVVITYVGTEDNIDVEPPRSAIGIGRVNKFRQDYDRAALGSIETIIVTPSYVRAQEETVCNEATIEIFTQRR